MREEFGHSGTLSPCLFEFSGEGILKISHNPNYGTDCALHRAHRMRNRDKAAAESRNNRVKTGLAPYRAISANTPQPRYSRV